MGGGRRWSYITGVISATRVSALGGCLLLRAEGERVSKKQHLG